MQEPPELPKPVAPIMYELSSHKPSTHGHLENSDFQPDTSDDLIELDTDNRHVQTTAAAELAVADLVQLAEVHAESARFDEHYPRVSGFMKRANKAVADNIAIVPVDGLAWYGWHTKAPELFLNSLRNLDKRRLVGLYAEALTTNDLDFADALEAQTGLRDALETTASTGLLVDYLLAQCAAGISTYENADEVVRLLTLDKDLWHRLPADAWKATCYMVRGSGDLSEAWYTKYIPAIKPNRQPGETSRRFIRPLASLALGTELKSAHDAPTYAQQLVLFSELARGEHKLTKEQARLLRHYVDAVFTRFTESKNSKHRDFYENNLLLRRNPRDYEYSNGSKWGISEQGTTILINLACIGDQKAIDTLLLAKVSIPTRNTDELLYAATRYPQLAQVARQNQPPNGRQKPDDLYSRAAALHGWNILDRTNHKQSSNTTLNKIETLWPIMLAAVSLAERAPEEAAVLYDEMFAYDQKCAHALSALEVELDSAQVKSQTWRLTGLAQKIEALTPLADTVDGVIKVAAATKNPHVTLELLIAAKNAQDWIEQTAPGTNRLRPKSNQTMRNTVKDLVLQAKNGEHNPYGVLDLYETLQTIEAHALPLSVTALHELFRSCIPELQSDAFKKNEIGYQPITRGRLEALNQGITCWIKTLGTDPLAAFLDGNGLYSGMTGVLSSIARTDSRPEISSLAAAMIERLNEAERLHHQIGSKQ